MSRIKSRAQTDVCGDCGAAGNPHITYSLSNCWLHFTIRRSFLGIHKPWYSAVQRMLLGSSQPRSSHFPSQVAAPRHLATVRLLVRPAAQHERSEFGVGTFADGPNRSEGTAPQTERQGSASSEQGRLHPGQACELGVCAEAQSEAL